MKNKKIIQIGDPRLRQKSKPIETSLFGTEKLHQLATLLISLMQKNNGVGLAAPQIGIHRKILVLGFEKSKRRPKEKPIPITVIINPEFVPLSKQMEFDYEGCLSVGNSLMAKVPRFKKIAYYGVDPEGNRIEREVTGLHARILQHEYDHLEGILFLDRVEDTRTYGFYSELQKVQQSH